MNERVYIVEGMTCGSCELSVREEVEELDGVESASVDRTTGRLAVRGDRIDDTAVAEAVAAVGKRVVTDDIRRARNPS